MYEENTYFLLKYNEVSFCKFNSDGSTFLKFLFLFFFVLNAAFVINVLHKASV